MTHNTPSHSLGKLLVLAGILNYTAQEMPWITFALDIGVLSTLYSLPSSSATYRDIHSHPNQVTCKSHLV